MAPTSRARRLSAVRQLFKFLSAEGVIEDDPALGFAGPKKGQAIPKMLSIAEVDRLIEAAQRRTETTKGRDRVRALRLHALIEMLYATGLRVTELVTLPRSVLAGDGRVLTIKGKGGRERLVPLNQAARAALDRYLSVGQHGEDDVAPMLRHQVPVCLARRGGPPDPPAARPGAERPGPGSGSRPRAGFAARAAPRLRQPSARPRRRPALRATVAGARRHHHHADLHARAGGTAQEARLRASSAGGQKGRKGVLSSSINPNFRCLFTTLARQT